MGLVLLALLLMMALVVGRAPTSSDPESSHSGALFDE
jgi:hypothetical protein